MDRRAAKRPHSVQLSLFDEREVAPVTDVLASPVRLIDLAGRIVEYRFRRSRRRTIGISVDANGLLVAAPHAAPWRDVERFLREKERWITARLAEWAGTPRPRLLRGTNGEALPLHGREVTLVVGTGRHAVNLDECLLSIVHPSPGQRHRILALLVKWLRQRALATLAPRAAHYAALLERSAPPVRISNARRQWGICMESGLIRLSWRLVHLDPGLADYVVAHEVAHLVHLDHSKRFWAVVEKLYPRWREAREQLELAGASLPIL